MIDIIITARYDYDTMEKTLCSIGIQSIKKLINVYIVNTNQNKDYKDICNKFSRSISIKELKLTKSKTNYSEKQYGVINSKSKYIFFLDDGDLLLDYFSIEKLYNYIEKNDYEIVISPIFVETKDNQLLRCEDFLNNLHGKIFKRKIVNKIKFADSKYNESSYFLIMSRLISNSIGTLGNPTYICRYYDSENNDDNLDLNYIKDFCKHADNILNFINNGNINAKNVVIIMGEIIMDFYYKYIINYDKKDCDELLKFIKGFYLMNKNFISLISPEGWYEYYTKYDFNKIPEISFNDFLLLLNK